MRWISLIGSTMCFYGMQVNVAQANNTGLGQQNITYTPWSGATTITNGKLSGKASIIRPSRPFNVTPYNYYDWCQAQTNSNVTSDQGATVTLASCALLSMCKLVWWS